MNGTASAARPKKPQNDSTFFNEERKGRKRYAAADTEALHAEFDSMKRRYDDLQARLTQPPAPEVEARMRELEEGLEAPFAPGKCLRCGADIQPDGFARSTPKPVKCPLCTESEWRIQLKSHPTSSLS